MAKRFTDTNKYKKPFYRNLPGPYKLFWDFLYHDCDHSGIWIVDFKIAQTYLGDDMVINRKQVIPLFNSDEVRIVEFDSGKKWFIVPFITFQYGKLSDKNRAHIATITALQKHNFLNPDLTVMDFSKDLISPLQGVKDMVKEQDKEKEQEKDYLGKSENPLISRTLLSDMHDVWKKSFPTYTDDVTNDFPACRNIADFVFRTSGVKSGFGDTDAEIKVLNTFQLIADQVNREPFWVNKPLKSISNNIQEFYNKIKNPINGNGTKHSNGSKIDDDKLKQKLAARDPNRK